MKKISKKILGFGAVGLFATTLTLMVDSPVRATLQQAGEMIAQAIRAPEVRLNLTVDKQTIELNEQGEEQIVWQDLGTQATVEPGDTLRYQVASQNLGEQAAKDLVITQPIAPQMIYILGSATTSNGAVITYSVDGGQTFVENPTIEVTLEDGTVEVQPAPADSYTHVRWEAGQELTSEGNMTVGYQVIVR